MFFSDALLLAAADAAEPIGAVVQAYLRHAVVAGLTANWMIVVGKVSEASGSPEALSEMPPERKLSYDSDAKVAGVMFAIGAVLGLAVAFAWQASGESPSGYWPLSALVGLIVGVFIPWSIVRQLGQDYLNRALDNYEQGAFREALQDAREVERISESLKEQAITIKEAAEDRLGTGPLASASLGGAAAEEDANSDEFSEFLSTYTPGSL